MLAWAAEVERARMEGGRVPSGQAAIVADPGLHDAF